MDPRWFVLVSLALPLLGLSGSPCLSKLYSDPSGHHAAGAPTSQLVGCKIDPDGGCVESRGSSSGTSVSPDYGAMIDPNG